MFSLAKTIDRMDSLFTPHSFPGKLIIVEGIDGSGKSTQLQLAMRYLQARGFRPFFTEWNSADLVKAITKKGKKKMSLTPMTFSLLHATDFAHRLVHSILPPLKAGMIVLADRYIYTAFARDVIRGMRAELGAARCINLRRGRIWRFISMCRST